MYFKITYFLNHCIFIDLYVFHTRHVCTLYSMYCDIIYDMIRPIYDIHVCFYNLIFELKLYLVKLLYFKKLGREVGRGSFPISVYIILLDFPFFQ